MRESLDQYFINRYSEELREELVTRGLDAKLVDDTVAESVGHLQEAVEAANPQNVEELQTVLAQFGPAARLARKLAAEEERRGKRKRFLWPTLLTPIFMWLALHPAPQARLFHNLMWAGTFFLLFGGAVLLALGFRARRPLFGQFAALIGLLIVGQVGWYTATSYPVKYTSIRSVDWYEAVSRSGYDREVASMKAYMDHGRETMRTIALGMAVFKGQQPATNVPAEFTYQGQYWFPEGIRELGLGIKPSEINGALLTTSWAEIVGAYNGSGSLYGHEGHAWDGDAARQLEMGPRDIAHIETALEYLIWVHTQPQNVRAVAFFRMVGPYTLLLCSMAAACTNAGWLMWLIRRALGRVRRRLTYGQPRNQAIT